MSKSHPNDPSEVPWYESAFGQDYLDVYAHRNERMAEGEVAFIMQHTPSEAHQRILDIACGAGRHMLMLCRYAELVVGVDLSGELLKEASRAIAGMNEQSAQALLVQADMRRLPFENEFTCAVMLFTSFGYFDSDDENLSVIQQATGALRAGGYFWMDYLNESHVRKTLKPFSCDRNDLRTIDQRRRITDEGRIEKEVRIITSKGETNYTESVKLYSCEQIKKMFEQSGLRVKSLWGDFEGHEYNADSPRLIIMGCKDG